MPATRTTQATHVPGAPAGVGRGQALRTLLTKALKRRAVLVHKNLCRMPDEFMAMSRMRLEVWLERNPWPSEGTVERFDLTADVDLVMPSNAEGRKLMNELRELLRPRTT